MELPQDNDKAARQLPKLKSLLNKYRQLRTMQSGLLRLSELAGKLTNIDSFYKELDSVISSLLITDCFHIVLLSEDENLELAYVKNHVESVLIDNLNAMAWAQSTTAYVFNTKQPLHCSSADRMALKQAGKISLFSSTCVDWLGVPLKRGNQVIGVLALQSYDENLYFDDRDCQLVEFIAEHIVTAIDRVRSRELLEQSIQERTLKLTKINGDLQREIRERQKAERVHQVLLAISEISAYSNDLPTFYEALHIQIKRLLPADNFYVAIISDDRKFLECPYYIDQRNNEHSEIEARPLGKGLSERTIVTGLPILVCHQNQYVLTEAGEIKQEPLTNFVQIDDMPKAWLSAPLVEQGAVFGMLAVQDYENAEAYQHSDLALMRFIAHHIAIAIIRKRNQIKAQEAKHALESMVQERTRELEQANLKLRMQIEERKKAEEKLFHDAYHDTLTKLPNRSMFHDRLTYSLSHYRRHPNRRFAVLFIDLDRFKMINDTLGHLAGDKFLIEIAKRLSECVREHDLLARLGGDEFVILLDAFQSEEDVEEIASRIISRVSEPYNLEGSEVYSNASIGIALFNSQYKEASDILRDADAAMYQAKSLGRGRYVFFDESMREQLLAIVTLEQELRTAIKEQQFELYYQEISALNKEDVIGFEAFLRWPHPTKGLLTPSHFLCMAEDSGLILEIENWVIEQVSAQLEHWSHDKKYCNAFIAINLSGKQLTQLNQLDKLIEKLTQYAINPERLILEFDESAFTKHAELALAGLNKLKDFGVQLALDNYGKGLSSFSFLHSYPFQYIKLDRAFIRELDSDDKNLALIQTLNHLGSQFGYRVVAEGIESQEVLNKLINIGCEYGQGYHLNRPEKISLPTESMLPQAERA